MWPIRSLTGSWAWIFLGGLGIPPPSPPEWPTVQLLLGEITTQHPVSQVSTMSSQFTSISQAGIEGFTSFVSRLSSACLPLYNSISPGIFSQAPMGSFFSPSGKRRTLNLERNSSQSEFRPKFSQTQHTWCRKYHASCRVGFRVSFWTAWNTASLSVSIIFQSCKIQFYFIFWCILILCFCILLWTKKETLMEILRSVLRNCLKGFAFGILLCDSCFFATHLFYAHIDHWQCPQMALWFGEIKRRWKGAVQKKIRRFFREIFSFSPIFFVQSIFYSAYLSFLD